MATLAPHLSRHPKGIGEEKRFWLKERGKRVRGYDRVHSREQLHKLCGSTKSRKERRTADRGCVWTTELSIKPRWSTDILSHSSQGWRWRVQNRVLHPAHAIQGLSHAVRVDQRSSYNTNQRRWVVGRATTLKESDEPTWTEIFTSNDPTGSEIRIQWPNRRCRNEGPECT